MKYPIGIQSFERIIEDGYVYIDKTDMIYSLTHGGSIYDRHDIQSYPRWQHLFP